MPADGAGAGGGGGGLFDSIFVPPGVLEASSDEAWLAALVTFERELAMALADLGMAPRDAARAVGRACDTLELTASGLGVAARASGNPVVPLVRALAAAAERDAPGHSAYVHFGATSQDALDTAAMLVAARVVALVLADLDRAAAGAAALARRHAGALMTGRTLLQPAVPITFGFKAARWLVALVEAKDALERVATGRLAVQLGGAAGTLAAYGSRGPELSARLAARLGLADPVLPWHADRSRLVELAGAVAQVGAACGKIALDVVLLAQSEVGEVTEGPEAPRGDLGGSAGGSSTMPQKSNPVGAVTVLAASRRAHAAAAAILGASVQDHERAGTGGWHAEWLALTGLLRAGGGCAAGTATLLAHLDVHPDRMRENLERTGGTVMSERVALDVSRHVGRARATALLCEAARRAGATGAPLRDVLDSIPEIAAGRSAEELDALLDPAGYLGATDQLVARALERYDAGARRGAPGSVGPGAVTGAGR